MYDLQQVTHGVTVKCRYSHTVPLGGYRRFLLRSGVVGFANGCREVAGAVILDHEGAGGT
jgi:hypothetical protein